MNKPAKYDFINIHDHGAHPRKGVFTIDNIMVHENRYPGQVEGVAYSCGAHPWYLDDKGLEKQLEKVNEYSSLPNVIAIGEAGLDRMRGGSRVLQAKAFSDHVKISENKRMPLFIHCVRAWDDLLRFHKELQPEMTWIVHGFRGKPALAEQLLDKGLYLSPWVEWAIRPVSAETLRTIPSDRLFLETDGFDIDIEPVYSVVAEHLGMEVETLRCAIYNNFCKVFQYTKLTF